jgi:hypothetical protein
MPGRLWHKTVVPVFLEKFILPLFAAAVIILALTNPMGFDRTQRITGSFALIFLAYFVARTVYKKTHPAPAGAPPTRSDGGRRLAEWQKVKLIALLSRYPGEKVLILASLGSETWDYARDFRDVFLTAKWNVEGPKPAPLSEPAIDVQVSADNYVPARPETQAVLGAFKFVGIKCRGTCILDPNIRRGLIVVWVGAKSPDEQKPDNYPPLSFDGAPN